MWAETCEIMQQDFAQMQRIKKKRYAWGLQGHRCKLSKATEFLQGTAEVAACGCRWLYTGTKRELNGVFQCCSAAHPVLDTHCTTNVRSAAGLHAQPQHPNCLIPGAAARNEAAPPLPRMRYSKSEGSAASTSRSSDPSDWSAPACLRSASSRCSTPASVPATACISAQTTLLTTLNATKSIVQFAKCVPTENDR